VIKEESKTLRIDLSKLTVLGEDLGAHTAIELANENLDTVRYCILLNPNLSLQEKIIMKEGLVVN
jgi:hypothetical protein